MKKIVLLTCIFFEVHSAGAQHMSMNHVVAPAHKNIFLTIMDTMMVKMKSAPSGETATACFILQMLPHHQGAIEMAEYEIIHGKNFTMIQLAKSILAEQTIEIQQMRLWIDHPADSVQATMIFHQFMAHAMTDMMQNMPSDNRLPDTDRDFAKVMVPHHQAAVDMAKTVIRFTKDHQVMSFANQIISSQQIEIEQMLSYLKQ